ncbi:MAG TPA: serine hydrolase [Sphingobacteriaceae bacterium]
MKKVTFLLLAYLAALNTFAQSDTPSFVKDSIDRYINWSITNWRIPGAAVCIVKDGKIVLQKGYGIKEFGLQSEVDANTLFMIGSNTKAITATALAILDHEKKISLDDRVTKWLPSFTLNNELAGEQAIIRDLLTHRLGFKTFQGDFTYWTSNLSRQQIIEKMGLVQAPYDFRTRWGYTNAGFVAAGEIIPKATGKQWEDFLKERIFNPLGMTSTIARSSDLTTAPNKAAAHTMTEGRLIAIPYPQIDNLAAAGSISSSVADMSKWVMMLLNNGKYNNNQIVPEAALQQTWFPHSILGNGNHRFNNGHFNLYGLGWFLEEYSGRKIISHTGGVNGFVTSVTLVPEENLGIVVLTNTDQNSFYEALKWEVVDSYLNLPFRNYSKVYLENFKKQRAEELQKDKALRDSVTAGQKARLSLNAYTGKYKNDFYGNLTIEKFGDELRMTLEHHPRMFVRLQPLGGDRFYATFSDPAFGTAVFPFSVQGRKVNGITVKVSDFIEYDPYFFTKQ